MTMELPYTTALLMSGPLCHERDINFCCPQPTTILGFLFDATEFQLICLNFTIRVFLFIYV